MQLPGGMPAQEFLRDYWQKNHWSSARPLQALNALSQPTNWQDWPARKLLNPVL